VASSFEISLPCFSLLFFEVFSFELVHFALLSFIFGVFGVVSLDFGVFRVSMDGVFGIVSLGSLGFGLGVVSVEGSFRIFGVVAPSLDFVDLERILFFGIGIVWLCVRERVFFLWFF